MASYWGTGAPPKPKANDFGDDRWAARIARVSGDLWQLDVVQKWGYWIPRVAGQPQIVGVVPGYGCALEYGRGPLLPGFNYVLAPTPRKGLPDAMADTAIGVGILAGAADLLGPGRSTVVDVGKGAMLCLREPVRVADAQADWQLDQDTAIPDELAALALAAPAGLTHSFLVGLWTVEYGYLHTGDVRVRIGSGRHWFGRVEVCLTGEYQDVEKETVWGGDVGAGYLRFSPVARPGQRWPLTGA